MALIGRIFVIILAVALASIAAGIAVAIGLLGPGWHALSGAPNERFFFWGTAFFATGITIVIGLMPLVILIAITESFKIRALLAYAVGGAIMLLASYYGSGLAPPSYEESIDYPPPPISRDAEITAAAGVVFGMAYWAIAGRNAGRWREG